MKTRTVFALALSCLAFAPVAANADPQQDQAACMNDAISVCGQFIPDRGRVAACLYSNVSRVSVGCRAVLARNDRSKVSQAKFSTSR